MGVPAFFRWLSKKYPSIVVHCIEEKPKIVNGEKIPVDSSQPNPNDVDFDNLYLDMNGIIHPCCHPENKPAPKDEEEMMIAIFEYIDRIFSIVRPRRLLYMAIDGVAPRAKMNQQRSRRFRGSKEMVEKVDLISKLREELQGKGIDLPPQKPKEEHFDNNCITPGTPFMTRLAKCLHYYIHDRLNSDPGWRDIEVILSDANAPGEGEHKIMDFIRRQRANPEHDANTRHCLCGADADLIMLGLATHEPNFTIIREEFKPNQPRPCELCGQIGHEMRKCTGGAKEKQGKLNKLKRVSELDVKFIFIRLNVLREYLAKELTMDDLPFPFDLEMVIDDWIFMCVFVGNDFLPHLPTLETRDGAIDRLIELYKRAVHKTRGYITTNGHVELSRVQLILTELSKEEKEIFQKRHLELDSLKKANKTNRNLKRKKRKMTISSATEPSPFQNARQQAYHIQIMPSTSTSLDDNPRQKPESRMKPSESEANDSGVRGEKRKKEDSESEEEPEDDVKLWEDGWKERYYEVKFKVDCDDIAFRHKVAAAYVEGLCWVLKYYYQGCASWNWYFPYHYAPFASDFVNIGDVKIYFDKGTPFKPLEQLMAVFPAASKSHVPESWGELMEDPDSSIFEYYPTDFKVDLNGKKYAWQGVALLPFVDEKRLLKALEAVYPKLTEEEKKRNVQGKDRLYIRNGHKGYDFLTALYENRSNWKLEIEMNPKFFSGMGGAVLLSEDVIPAKAKVPSPLPALPDIPQNATICINFVDPQYPDNYIFSAEKLKSAVDPPKVLKHGQMPVTRNRNNFRRSQVGNAPYNERANLNAGGHQMLQRSVNDRSYNYGNVPLPNAPRGPAPFAAQQSYSSVAEVNVAAHKHGTRVLLGKQREALLDGDVHTYDRERSCTRHPIDDNDGQGILVKLGRQCKINHMRMLLWDRDKKRSYSYYIEVSVDQTDWVRVIDYSNYLCRSWQQLYFKPQVVRYIRIVGTHNTVNRFFHVVSFECMYTNRSFWLEKDLLYPAHNVATISASAWVTEGVSQILNALIDGDTENYDQDSGYTSHQLGSGSIILQLAQPFMLDSMRMLLWDCDDRSYSYYIEVSTDQQNWHVVVDKREEACRSWQVITFPSRPVVFIRIVGTHSTANRAFQCIHFECPAQTASTSSPNSSTSSSSDFY